jgi:plastocyanin
MATYYIVIDEIGYHPMPGTPNKIQPGDYVWWLNNGTRPHSATADDRSFDTAELDPGKSARISINHAPGAVPYHDKYSGIRGQLEVA